ncbi:MAG TPA: DUF4097 family beta strand repeat-containing protein [Pyrinomonadaceae bacterium]|nr:DUF4097 family beta strand repeat-containing protein [Pyrinomonadaceae bacterium]
MSTRSKAEGKRRALAALLLAALLLPQAAGAGRAQTGEDALLTATEEFHQTYPLAAGGRVSLSNINGRVKITGWDRDEVKVDAVKRARTQEALRDARIRVEAGAASVHVETEYDGRHWERGEGDRRTYHAARVDYTLTVPRGARVQDVSVVNGPLDIENLTGPVEASSVNGGVTARGLAGRVDLSVVNGQLEAALDSLGGENNVSLSAVNGQLNVTLPSDANAHLKAGTVHGSINNDLGLPVREGRYVGRDLEGQLGTGRARVNLSNVNGTITIRRAADNKPRSEVRNLLSETREADEFDFDDDQDKDKDKDKDKGKDQRDMQREIERAARVAEREANAEARAEARAAARAAAQSIRESAREGERVAREVEREVQREMSRSFGDGVNPDASRQIVRDSATLATKGVPRVRVATFDGPVTVHAWDKPEVRATIVKRAYDDREMKGIKVSSVVSNDAGPNSEVNIRAEFDKSVAQGALEHDGRIISWNSGASVELDVYVPRNSMLSITSGDGRLVVEGVRGEMELHTGDGAIDVTGAAGRLRAGTGDGRILIEGFDGEADAETGDGRITLDGSFRQLSARTGDGTILLTLPGGVNAVIETDASAVSNDGVAVAEDANEERRVRRWRVGNGGQVFTLRTGDGRVILQRR